MNRSSLPTLRAAGFDSVETGTWSHEGQGKIAKEARRLGMTILAHPGALRESPAAATSSWPVRAWYLFEEPEVNPIAPEELQKLSARTREWDPRRLQTFVIGSGVTASGFGHITDVLMLDWYPVPHLPLDSVADQIDQARGALPPGKPLWMILQAFDWRDDAQRDSSKERVGRFPTGAEIRFMSYISIVHHVDGLFFFSFRKPHGRNLLDFPAHWQALTSVSRELRLFQPVLANGYEVAFPYPLEQGLEARAWGYRGSTYLVIVNRRTQPVSLPAGLLENDWRPLFESRRKLPRLIPEGKVPGHRVLVLKRG